MMASQRIPTCPMRLCDRHGAAPSVTEAEAEDLVRGICFKTGPPRTVGVELEWLVHELRPARAPRARRPPRSGLRRSCGPCP